MKTAAAVLALWLAPVAFAQPPALENAHVEKRSAAGGLEAAMRAIMASQSEPAWVGYAVPAVAGQHSMCCSDSWQCCGGCSLEGRTAQAAATPSTTPAAATGPVYLEGPKQFLVFYRIERNQLNRLQVYSPDCQIDAGGLPFIWLSDVKPAESISWLTSLARDKDWRPESAVMAIALHAAPEAVPTLLDLAHNGRTTSQRSRALSWLARTASPKISEPAIDEAIEKDPATEVKRQAVFALSQIPHNDGVPRLIQLARTTRDQNVRKQAMLWLGRVKDERAYKFFEEVLAH